MWNLWKHWERAAGWGRSPDTILQLMVIGWKDFPGDSAGLGGWPCGTILQLAVMGWKAELLWEPKVILSLALGRVGVRSPAVRLDLWPSADLPVSVLMKPDKKYVRMCWFIFPSNKCVTFNSRKTKTPLKIDAVWCVRGPDDKVELN